MTGILSGDGIFEQAPRRGILSGLGAFGSFNEEPSSLDLRFAQDKHFTVDTTTPGSCLITARRGPDAAFSRASGATFTDSDGLVKWAPENLVTYSQQINGAGGYSIGAPTEITENGIVGTLEGIPAWSFTSLATSGSYALKTVAGTAGTQYTASYLTDTITGGNAVVVTTPNSNLFPFVFTELAAGVYLASVTFTVPVGDTGILIQVGRTDAPINTTFRVTAVQLNRGSLCVHFPTTSATVYGPRFEHDPLTGECLGLLREEQRTNLIKQSGNLAGDQWIDFSGCITSSDPTPPPIEGASVALLQFGGAANSQRYQNVGAVGGDYTLSCWIKCSAGTSLARLTLYNGSSFYSPDLIVTTTWTRFSFTVTAAAGIGNVGLVNASDGAARNILATGFNLELGSSPSSYIPTTTAPVVRSADVCSIEGADFASFYNQSEGTLVVTISAPLSGTTGIFSLNDGTASERLEQSASGTNPQFVAVDGGVLQSSLDAGTLVPFNTHKLAIAWAANSFSTCLDDGSVVTDTSGTMPTPDRLQIGVTQAAASLNGTIARLTYYPKRLSDFKLINLTI